MDCLYFSHYQSPLGDMTIAGDGEFLTGLWFDGQSHFGLPAAARKMHGLRIFEETRQWLDKYFGGVQPGGTPKIRLEGSPFRLRVWNELLRIPYGKTLSYKDIARSLGKGMSCQAVGGAIGHNPVSIIVPCHRVIGSDGSLTGYAAGIGIKRALLELERRL